MPCFALEESYFQYKSCVIFLGECYHILIHNRLDSKVRQAAHNLQGDVDTAVHVADSDVYGWFEQREESGGLQGQTGGKMGILSIAEIDSTDEESTPTLFCSEKLMLSKWWLKLPPWCCSVKATSL